MDKGQIFNLLKEESKWGEGVNYETFLDEPYLVKNTNVKISSLNLTPFGIVELMLKIEKLFLIEVDETVRCKTVGDIVDYIYSKIC